MEDHWDKDSVKSKGAFKAFTGEGQKVGSPAPQGLSTSFPDQPTENKAKASSSVLIVQSEPTTNIQIWLADGGRLVQKFNHSHKISNIRLFITDASHGCHQLYPHDYFPEQRAS
ncbi:NSFL1 cofactor p47 [Plecturocebus cupreus]